MQKCQIKIPKPKSVLKIHMCVCVCVGAAGVGGQEQHDVGARWRSAAALEEAGPGAAQDRLWPPQDAKLNPVSLLAQSRSPHLVCQRRRNTNNNNNGLPLLFFFVDVCFRKREALMLVYVLADVHVIWQLLQLGKRINIYVTNINFNMFVKEKEYKVES